MRVFQLEPDNDHFHNFALVRDDATKIYRQFDGTPFDGEWTPLEIMAVDTDDELALLGDHGLLGTVPVLSQRAVAALTDMVQSNCEILPLVYARSTYVALNVTTVVDALDERRSEVTRFSTGRIMSIDKFMFRPESLIGHTIFKIPQLLRGYVFVTDAFVHRVRLAGLEGFTFVEIWHVDNAGDAGTTSDRSVNGK